jgi:hypothetical protein
METKIALFFFITGFNISGTVFRYEFVKFDPLTISQEIE